MEDENDRDSDSEYQDNDRNKDFFDDDDLSNLSGGPSKRAKKNGAKAVECLDLAGNVLGVFNSGISAVRALGIQQGDISLCCRGLRDSINGYRFRFVGDYVEPSKVMKGDDDRFTRLTRNRVETGMDRGGDKPGSLLAPPEIKSRTWQKKPTAFGRLSVPTWIPNQATPTEGLKDFQNSRNKAKSNRRRKSGAP